MKEPKRTVSWFSGYCKDCGYPIVVTQTGNDDFDYWWYCSNKLCKNHEKGEQTGDMDVPSWVNEDYSRD
jgi:hypothetical protein